MSRYTGDGDYEGEPEQILAMGRWERNARAVLKSKRGRKALTELREALMALPGHRLIEGAVCTVGAGPRRAAHLAEAEAAKAFLDQHWAGKYPPAALDTTVADDLAAHVERDGEGVCAIGALVWHRKVKAGTDPAEAFASLPDLPDEGEDGLNETAGIAVKEAGMAYTLAWELAYRNDELFADKTPEERWTAFVEWIDQQLAGASS